MQLVTPPPHTASPLPGGPAACEQLPRATSPGSCRQTPHRQENPSNLETQAPEDEAFSSVLSPTSEGKVVCLQNTVRAPCTGNT